MRASTTRQRSTVHAVEQTHGILQFADRAPDCYAIVTNWQLNI